MEFGQFEGSMKTPYNEVCNSGVLTGTWQVCDTLETQVTPHNI